MAKKVKDHSRQAYGRKKYATEFVLRSDDPNLILDLDKIANDNGLSSVNKLINNVLQQVKKNPKKYLVISR